MPRSSCTWMALPLLALLASAAPAQQKLPESPYFPLAVGTQWQYRVQDNAYSLRVTAHEMKGDVLCARLETRVGDRVVAVEHLRVGDKGSIYRHALDGKVVNPPILLLKLPCEKDAKWTIDSQWTIAPDNSINNRPAENWTLKGTFTVERADVTVNGNTYKDTIKVTGKDLQVKGKDSEDAEEKSFKMSMTNYFAVGVGLIKQELVIADKEDQEPARLVAELYNYQSPR